MNGTPSNACVRYIARSAVSNERLSVNDRGQVVYRLKHSFGDGTAHVVLDPMDFMRHIRVPHPFGVASGCANRQSCRTAQCARSRTPGLPITERVLTAPTGAPRPRCASPPQAPRLTPVLPCSLRCRLQIASARPRNVRARTDNESDNDHTTETDTLQIEFRDAAVAETRDRDENTPIDFDGEDNVCAITVEHVSKRAGIPWFSHEQVAA